MWALAPETEGVACDVDDPVARALCEWPELRGLDPYELAAAIGTSPAEAQAGILRLASRASGVRVVLRGVSFDDAISAGGRVLGRAQVAYAREAGALGNGSAGSSETPSWVAAALLLTLGFFFTMALTGGATEREAD